MIIQYLIMPQMLGQLILYHEDFNIFVCLKLFVKLICVVNHVQYLSIILLIVFLSFPAILLIDNIISSIHSATISLYEFHYFLALITASLKIPKPILVDFRILQIIFF